MILTQGHDVWNPGELLKVRAQFSSLGSNLNDAGEKVSSFQNVLLPCHRNVILETRELCSLHLQ